VSFDVSALRAAFSLPEGQAYLDNAAMAQMPHAVVEAMVAELRQPRANVHRGLYAWAERADEAYEAARERVAAWLGAAADEIVFTGGCTLALNLAARALGEGLGPGDSVVVSRAEHHSSLLPWLAMAEAKGFRLRWLGLTEEGRLDLSDLSAIDASCRVVAVTHASNVTGAVTDVARLAEAAHGVGALMVVDGAQAVPHGKVSPLALGADLYAFAGHKAYGPTGIGVLWGRRKVLHRLPPAIVGGGMVARVDDSGAEWAEPPSRFEAGTPPVAQAIGLAAALDWMDGLDWPAVHAYETGLTARLLAGLAGINGVRVVGPQTAVDRLPVVSVVVEGCHPHDLAHLLASRGVAVRGGHHCAQPLMNALGLAGTVRASLAPYNTALEVDMFLTALESSIGVLR
jgi:cysteine desulfurase / selenocysteine lyase